MTNKINDRFTEVWVFTKRIFVQVQVFGFRSDGEPRQLLYLFDEGQSIGIDGKNAHGPDAVISMVHHGLESLGKGERTCVLHADNCAGKLYLLKSAFAHFFVKCLFHKRHCARFRFYEHWWQNKYKNTKLWERRRHIFANLCHYNTDNQHVRDIVPIGVYWQT